MRSLVFHSVPCRATVTIARSPASSKLGIRHMRGVLLIGCIAFGCAHSARPPPLTGWKELRSDHFRLKTDLPLPAARVTLGRLETLRAALQSAWMVPGDTPDSAEVVVLGETTELLNFTDWLGLTGVSGALPLLVTAAGNPSAFEDA